MSKVYFYRTRSSHARAASLRAPTSSVLGDRAVRRPGRIFVVHGDGDPAKQQLEVVLRRLGLEPISLGGASGGSSIDVLENEIDFTSDFGIAVFTPEDVAYARGAGPEGAEARARQNVVLGSGMLLAALSRERVAILVQGQVALPSHLRGVRPLHYEQHVCEVATKLAERLARAGICVDDSGFPRGIA